MNLGFSSGTLSRRRLLEAFAGGLSALLFGPLVSVAEAGKSRKSKLFWVHHIPKKPFQSIFGPNHHTGIDTLLHLMGAKNLKFYRTSRADPLGSPRGMIASNDVVLIKVNAQWKYRGCTNSDVIRGLIQSILDHPDGFTGEVVLIENGQGWGSLRCDTTTRYADSSVQANANNRRHSFEYLVDRIFDEPRVSSYLFDPIRRERLERDDHTTDGYRILDNVSYPCFTTAGGHHVELREGIWTGSRYTQNLKLINVPVLKHHDIGGSEITASLKHMYGVLSMEDGRYDYRHYDGLGETCGNMFARVRAPVLNIIDAIWVSQSSLSGYPKEATTRVNQLVAGQDPVALDYWAAKHILYPIDQVHRHHPDYPGIQAWLTDAQRVINQRRCLWKPSQGLRAKRSNLDEKMMALKSYSATKFLEDQRAASSY